MTGTHYLASEDSALIRKVLKGHSGGRALEIGAGNGGNLVDLADRFDLVAGTDLVRPGMSDWSDRGADFVLADGATCFRDSTFELVAFNPPYVRAVIVDRAVDGGEGLEVPRWFMKEALRVVRGSGRVVFLLSGEDGARELGGICAAKGFRVNEVDTVPGFFERLSVFLAERA